MNLVQETKFNQLPRPTNNPPAPMRQIQQPQFHAQYAFPQQPRQFAPLQQPKQSTFPQQQQRQPAFPQQKPRHFAPANVPPRNPSQNPAEKPVPMEVDPSIRSRQINYTNRPKRPRNLNIATQNEGNTTLEEKAQYTEESELLQKYYNKPYEGEGEHFFERVKILLRDIAKQLKPKTIMIREKNALN